MEILNFSWKELSVMGFIVIILAVAWVKSVPTGWWGMMYFFNKLVSAKKDGLCLVLWPFYTIKINTHPSTEIIIDLPEFTVASGEGDPKKQDPYEQQMNIKVNGRISFKIIDAVKLETTKNLAEAKRDAIYIAESFLRGEISKETLRKIINTWTDIKSNTEKMLKDVMNTWGLEFLNFKLPECEPADKKVLEEIDDISKTIAQKREEIIKAEKDLEVGKLKAELKFQEDTKKADGIKVLAEAGAYEIKKISEANKDNSESEDYRLKIAYFKSLEKISDGKANKVFINEKLGGGLFPISEIISDTFKKKDIKKSGDDNE